MDGPIAFVPTAIDGVDPFMHLPILALAHIPAAAPAGRMLAVLLKRRPTSELKNIYIASTLVLMLVVRFLLALLGSAALGRCSSSSPW